MDVTITNHLPISSKLSSSGQPDRDDFIYIASEGYQVVINLSMPDSKSAISDEGNLVTSLGITYLHIPVPFDTPELQELRTFFKAMNAFSEQKVWVHCALNYRVSAFLYLYNRVVLNKTKQEAKKYMLPSWEPNQTWQAFIQRAEDHFIDKT